MGLALVLVAVAGCGAGERSAKAREVETAWAARAAKEGRPEVAPHVTIPATTTTAPEAQAETAPADSLTTAGWRRLQQTLVGLLIFDGGAKSYLNDMQEIEEGGVIYVHDHCSLAPTRCLLNFRSTMSSQVTHAQVTLAQLAEQAPHECSAAIAHANVLLGRWRHVIETTVPEARLSEEAWEKSQQEAEPLELPEGYLGDGLASCDPNGSGEIESAESG
jgi:hypothetical protein